MTIPRGTTCFFFFFQAEDGIRDLYVTGVQTCALPICSRGGVDLEAQIRQLRAGRDSAQRKADNLGGIAVYHFQPSKSGYPVAPSLDETFEAQRLALDDLEE